MSLGTYWPAFWTSKVHKSRKISWFVDEKRRIERLNLEGGNVACDSIVEDNIVNGHILAGILDK